MKTITLLNEKGGVGKTTLSITLAAGLAIAGHRVLLIDTDPQANATIGLGLEPEPAFHDLIVRKASFNDVTYPIAPERLVVPDEVSRLTGELLVIPSDKETRNVAETAEDAFSIIRRIGEIIQYVDFVIFDTSPTPSTLHSMIYMASDGLIHPTTLESFSLHGLGSSIRNQASYDAIRTSQGLPPTVTLGVIPNLTSLQTTEHSANWRHLVDAFGRDMVWRPIHRRIAWAEATAAQRSIFAYEPGGKAAGDARRLVNQFLAVVNRV